MDRGGVERFTEFLIVGVLLGVTEDLLAVTLATGAEFNLSMLGIVLLVAVPFAAFSELVVDSDDYLVTERIAERIRDLV